VPRERFRQRFGLELGAYYARQIEKLRALGLLEWDREGESLRLTGKGRLLGNQVFLEFI